MAINVSNYSNKQSFVINGVSYIGKPQSNTAMFVTIKVGHLVKELYKVQECLIFAETGLTVDEVLLQKHCFVFSDSPQFEYAQLTEALSREEETEESAIPFIKDSLGCLVSNNAVIGEGTKLAPGVVIGPGVIIGKNARIYSGAIISHSTIGDNCIINEYAVIGSNGFTMANDKNGDKTRIYSLGAVEIGNNVEIGAHDNISRGSGGNTVIEDNVKIDALVHVGHDVHLHKNVEITAGAVIGGFVEAFEGAYVGINSVIRNRITLGKNCFVGMGSNVTKSVDEGITVVGNPAKPLIK